MARFRPVLKFDTYSHQSLCDYSKGAALALTGNLNFPAPVIPTIQLDTDNDAMQAAILAWGPPTNRGSEAQYQALLAAEAVVMEDMRINCAYVDSIAQGDIGMILSSGYEASQVPAPHGILPPPANFRAIFKRVTSGTLPLRWNAVKGANAYNVYAAATPTDPFVLIATVTKASYDFTGVPGRLIYVTIRAVGAAGLGIETSPLAAHTSF